MDQFQADNRADIDLLEVYQELRARRGLMLRFAMLLELVLLVVVLLLPARYRSVVTMLPPKPASSSSAVLFSQKGTPASTAGSGASPFGGAMPSDFWVSLMRSRSVEYALVDRFHLQAAYHTSSRSAARKVLEKRSEISAGAKGGLVTIAVEDREPQQAASLANGFVDEMKTRFNELVRTEAVQRRNFLDYQTLCARQDLAESERRLKQTEAQTGLIHLSSQTRALMQASLSLEEQISAKEVSMVTMRSFAGPANPALIRAGLELDELRVQKARLNHSGGQDDLLPSRQSFPEDTLQYFRAFREYKMRVAVYESLLNQRGAASFDEVREGAIIQIVDRAVPADKKQAQYKLLILAGGILAGLMLGFFAALLNIRWTLTIQDIRVGERVRQFRTALGWAKVSRPVRST